jgi:Transposase DDE domain
VAIDPDSEVICAAEVGPANRRDAAMAEALLADLPAAADAAAPSAAQPPPATTTQQVPVVYGDAAYGTGALLADLAQRGVTAMTKVAAPPRRRGTSPRTGSASTCRRARSPAQPGSRSRSSRPAAVAGWPASAVPARSARCKAPAPAAEPAAPSPSTRTRRTSRRPDAGSVASGLAG